MDLFPNKGLVSDSPLSLSHDMKSMVLASCSDEVTLREGCPRMDLEVVKDVVSGESLNDSFKKFVSVSFCICWWKALRKKLNPF